MSVVDYQTRDGLAEFGFSVEFRSDIGWRVYIVFDPFSWAKDQQINLPYESIDHAGRRYVNWSSRIDSLGEARTVAEIWAELVHRAQQHATRTEQVQRQPDTTKPKTATPPGTTRPNAGKAA